MSNYTRGLWTKDEYGDLKSPDGEQVSVWGLGISHGQRNEKREANTALITAAPELLDSLKEIMVILTIPAFTEDRCVKAILDAQEAIRKAEGQP